MQMPEIRMAGVRFFALALRNEGQGAGRCKHRAGRQCCRETRRGFGKCLRISAVLREERVVISALRIYTTGYSIISGTAESQIPVEERI